MNYISEFKDRELSKEIIKTIENKVREPITIMEVCGTHTMTIYKNGIDKILPSKIKLLSGPGCPVCVTPQGVIDDAINVAKRDNVIIATFGDMMRVPGTHSTLLKEKALGRDIVVIYSPLDLIKICKDNLNKEVIFLAVGFETTSPAIALLLIKGKKLGVKNLSILHSMKKMPKAMETLILQRENKVDGFICPGHVGTIIGVEPFNILAKKHNIPMVMSGFEAIDVLGGILKLVHMIEERNWTCENLYGSAVEFLGNKKAQSVLEEVFCNSSSYWRGIGHIENTGFQLSDDYREFDAYIKFGIQKNSNYETKGCSCGEILTGNKHPTQCKLFGKTCTPCNPIGPCMVSYEGACANVYKYGKK